MGTAASKPLASREAYYNNGTKDPNALCNKGYLLDPPRLTADSDRCDVELPADTRSAPHARHMNKVNVAFCDGHCATLTLQEMGYVVNADGSIPANGSGATNKLFAGTGGEDTDPPSIR